jgi:hypothetical protein
MTRIIIAGGRDFKDTEEHKQWLLIKLLELKVTEVVCGMARGADLFGKKVAEENNIIVKKFPADWKKYGNSAGYKRNVQMAEYADICILFPGGKGTKHMKDIAIEKGLEVIEYPELTYIDVIFQASENTVTVKRYREEHPEEKGYFND